MTTNQCEFPLIYTTKLIRDVQDNVLLNILDISVFPNILPYTTFHVHRWGILFPECLPSGSTIINSFWWCYKCLELHVHVTIIIV